MKIFEVLSRKKFILNLLILVFSIRFLQSFCMLKHGDSLYYHLVGGRYWVETSLIEMTKSFHPFFLAGLFDYLYVIPNFFFGPTLLTQVVGQNMHFMFSMGLGSFILFNYFRGSIWAYLGPLLILTISKSQDFFFYAKNDGVVASLGLLAAILIIEKDSIKRLTGYYRFAIIGILLGLLPAIKMYGLFASASLGLVLIYLNYKEWKKILLVCVLGLLTWSPILIRNYIFLDTAIFPGLLNRFPGNLTEGMIAYLTNSLNASVGFAEVLSHLRAAFMGKIVFLLSPALFIFNYKFKKIGNLYLILVFLFMAFYGGLNGGWIFERYYFVCYFWLSLFLVKSLSQYELKRWMIPLLLVLILVDGRVDLGVSRISKTFKLYLTAKNSTAVVRKISKFTEFWDFVEPNSLVLSDRASEVFYAPAGVRLHNYTESREAEFIYRCKEENLVQLKAYSYFIKERNLENPCYQKILEKGTLLHQVFNYKLYDIRGILKD
ncbi:MAG: hypothetical protein ACJAT2_000991 [Bacteriovoracaceae bacterium]|jgi:hypothetical protein